MDARIEAPSTTTYTSTTTADARGAPPWNVIVEQVPRRGGGERGEGGEGNVVAVLYITKGELGRVLGRVELGF